MNDIFTLSEHFSFGYATTLADVPPAIWSACYFKPNAFLELPYLRAISRCPPKGYQLGFLIFYQLNQPVGITVLFRFDFKASQSVQLQENTNLFKRWLLRQINFSSIVCGNPMLTGDYGFNFHPSIPRATAIDLIVQASQYLKQTTWQAAKIFTFKEFFTEEEISTPKGYNRLAIQPNMILEIPPDWQAMADYAAALKRKYRTRFKRARRLLLPLQQKRLQEKEIEQYQDQIYACYRQIVEAQTLNVVHIQPDYFRTMKQELGDQFDVVGYFDGVEMVGFYSTIWNYGELIGHYVGFDQQLNRQHQIYLNILLDILQDGIRLGSWRVVYARTALAIKSSIGAIPFEMYGFVKHDNFVVNRLLQLLLTYYSPDQQWVARHPFKQKNDNS